ncbi:PREDICTED: uncharacterized protein LOC108354564 [Rhagoletis zephyria]|uniref:uncharacterized protein LOC108354564 n=1 Tax=Rhagoletis zephyria TaxID=28612 RepID=UPI0008118D70|nr:PREDICTED: uncharacterized protein LOC108354564 [Rhagoletis zephyria]
MPFQGDDSELSKQAPSQTLNTGQLPIAPPTQQIGTHLPEFHVDATMAPRINPPNMSDTNIESYFLSLEFWFAATGVSHDGRKYNLVMAQVPPNKLTELRAIIDATPAQNRYDYIKSKLISHFADSQQRRVQRVLSDMPLGDLKPSQLFNEMRLVAGNALCETVLLDLWASRLPPYAQAAVIASKGDVADKVTIADAIVDSLSFRQVNMVGSISPSQVNPPPPGEREAVTLESLQKEISQLTKQFQSLASRRSRSRSQSRSRNQRNNRSESTSATGLCWYHERYGANARKCKSPCNYNTQQSHQ